MAVLHKHGRSAYGSQLLRGYLERHSSLDLLDAAFQSELESGGPEPAYKLVRNELQRNPTLLGLDKLLEARVLVAPAEGRADLELVKNLIHGHTRRVAVPARCQHVCGGWPRGRRADGALPGLRRLGDLSAQAHGRIRFNTLRMQS